MVETTDHFQVLAPGQIFIDSRVLARESDPTPDRDGVLHHIATSYDSRTFVRLEECSEHTHGSGLSRTIWPQQP
jgi:hypothetical protein